MFKGKKRERERGVEDDLRFSKKKTKKISSSFRRIYVLWVPPDRRIPPGFRCPSLIEIMARDETIPRRNIVRC